MNARRLGTRLAGSPCKVSGERHRRRTKFARFPVRRSREPLIPCLLLLLLLPLGSCAHPREVPQVDVRAEEEEVIRTSIRAVLEREGYTLEPHEADDRFFTTEWQPAEDRLSRVTVRLTHTTLGFALSTKVVLASADEGQADPIMRFACGGLNWVVTSDTELKAKAKEREAFLGREIQALWQDSRRTLLESQSPR
ncbi:MAG: hypothetical protein AUK47_00115 [Deltaproteobacteria bacterium CG2_30_63_29]|nr:MAG: hypothetical protein AUK47_00115 [Deltaproteobacteria bacterium CG2_30_63_29]PIV99034.1 MAG: hypothetical protein COW42_12395 [Deltaproteobacteria bacterium CG17_big_fil_post_rev_8_21_14_2_50_63_7]PJB34312.1 MAG: hypothetical protein CO108_28515 [Deltaproteobacteria bacterium CG_4_9_14_3_um_filter_63_12]